MNNGKSLGLSAIHGYGTGSLKKILLLGPPG